MLVEKRRHQTQALPELALSLSKTSVPRVSSTSHLGFHLSSNLTWSDHVFRSMKQVNFKVFTLK